MNRKPAIGAWVRFLQVTDTHFGLPANSVGLKMNRPVAAAAANQLLQRGLSAATLMATHDEGVFAALKVLVELEAGALDAGIISGDIATTGNTQDLALASALLRELLPDGLRLFAIAGNHDRFGPPATYRPGGTLFDVLVTGERVIALASPFGFGHQVLGSVLLVGLDLTLTNLAGIGALAGRGLALGHARDEIIPPFTETVVRLAAQHTPSHVVIVTHFPVEIGQPIRGNHRVISGNTLSNGFTEIAMRTGLPTLVLSGHLHQEYFVRRRAPSLWFYTCPSTTKQYPLGTGQNSCAIIETNPQGFTVQRYDYDRAAGRNWFAAAPSASAPGMI